MASKRSTSAKNPGQFHTTLEYRRDETPGIIVRHGGSDELRYLEFALPDKQRSVRVEWNPDDYCFCPRKDDKGVPVQLTIDNDRPRALTYKNGAFYQKGRSAPFVDKKAAPIGERLAEVFAERGGSDRGATRSLQNRGGADPFGWFGCVSDKTQAGAGLGAAVGGVGGLVAGGVAGAATGAGAGGGLGAAAGACWGLGWCTAEAIWG